ncbi:MAG TPA: DinB family protein [Bacteroidota bacterium]
MTLQNFISYVDYMMNTTEHLFQQIPPDNIDWKPTESSFAIGQQMAHMVEAVELFSRGITEGDWGYATIRERFLKNRHTPTITVEEALARLKEHRATFNRRIGALSEEQFRNGEIIAPNLGAGTFPRWRVALLFIEHHLDHKTELFMYLKLLGVKVNSGHLYRGPS